MDFINEKERIYSCSEDGSVIAEITFPITDGVAVINHTFVDSSLRGQGIAGKLVKMAADQLRSEGLKAHPTCTYAVGWFEKHPEYNDIKE